MPQQPGTADPTAYRGRLAPTPSGWLHLGHAVTFSVAWQRARYRHGSLLYRCEDLDPHRCRPAFSAGALEDLRWWGLDWDEGPDSGGPCTPYVQSERLPLYRDVLASLIASGHVYPSPHSRREIAAARPARSPVDGDILFPADLRQPETAPQPNPEEPPPGLPFRFRVPDGRIVRFTDGHSGSHAFLAGRDFGDFLVWRREGVPAYELAVTVDDHFMAITEVVRGEDLLLSTARQLLLYEALGWMPPAWYHCPLVIDPATGKRMSKTHRSLGLRALREAGFPPGLEPAAYLRRLAPGP